MPPFRWAVSQSPPSRVGGNGFLAGLGGGRRVAHGPLQVAEVGEDFPWLGGVTEELLALDGALDFASGFVVTTQFEQFVRDVALRLGRRGPLGKRKTAAGAVPDASGRAGPLRNCHQNATNIAEFLDKN